jgi:hypothetical protein
LTLAGHPVAEVTVPDDHPTPPVVIAGHESQLHEIHMPRTSWWPLIVAVGLFMLLSGVIFTLAMSFVGLAIMFIGVAGWSLEPASGESVYV